jgi:hypothetical protein
MGSGWNSQAGGRLFRAACQNLIIGRCGDNLGWPICAASQLENRDQAITTWGLPNSEFEEKVRTTHATLFDLMIFTD